MNQATWDELARRFEAGEIAKEEWTHVAHIAVGAWMLAHCERAEAGARMRAGIQRLNVRLGGENTADAGFHETLTEFWLLAIAIRLERGMPLEEILRLPAGLWREHYSVDLPKCRASRREWTPPDLKPIEA
jgi:hypothetical protein